MQIGESLGIAFLGGVADAGEGMVEKLRRERAGERFDGFVLFGSEGG